MNTRTITAAMAALSATLIAAEAQGFSSGPPSGLTGSPGDGITCAVCHGNAVGSGSVQILGAPSSYSPNETYTLTIRVSDPMQVGGGFQITVEDTLLNKVGMLLVSDAVNTQYSGGDVFWINHTLDGVNDSVTNWGALGNAAEYEVQWQAPASDIGPITFYAAGNAVNRDFDLTGDIVYTTSAMMTFNDCPWDLDGDGAVGSADLASLLGDWATYGSTGLAALLGSWGPCP